MWDEIYDVYVADKHDLGIRNFYEKQNPAALEDVSATMLESARKGMWKATDQQLAALARLHTELVNKYGPSGSQRVMDNAKLRDFIAQKVDPEQAQQYRADIDKARKVSVDNADKGMVMKKETMSADAQSTQRTISTVVIIVIVIVILVIVAVLVRRRRKTNSLNQENWKQQ